MELNKFNKGNTYKNRGMFLEYLINESNKYYLMNNIGVIYKKPTPIQVVKINNQNKIIEAYFKESSTSDYNGLYKKKYIDFEAKQTESNTSFPLSNYTKNELSHLYKIEENGGVAFTIIYFKNLNLFYLYEIKKMKEYLKDNQRKSIPLKEIKEKGYLINQKLNIPLDYLSILDLFINHY